MLRRAGLAQQILISLVIQCSVVGARAFPGIFAVLSFYKHFQKPPFIDFFVHAISFFSPINRHWSRLLVFPLWLNFISLFLFFPYQGQMRSSSCCRLFSGELHLTPGLTAGCAYCNLHTARSFTAMRVLHCTDLALSLRRMIFDHGRVQIWKLFFFSFVLLLLPRRKARPIGLSLSLH